MIFSTSREWRLKRVRTNLARIFRGYGRTWLRRLRAERKRGYGPLHHRPVMLRARVRPAKGLRIHARRVKAAERSK